MVRWGWSCAMVLAITLLTVACSEDPVVQDDDATGTVTEESDGTESGPGLTVDVVLGETEFGEVLVDGDGMTLYLFTEDPPGESVCVDDCLAAWPPLLIDGEPRTGEGVDASLVGTIERPDDGVQLTYDDAPLYTWAADQQPGEVTGQGVQGVWFVVTADGAPVTDTEAGGEAEAPAGEQETRSEY